MKKEEKKYTFSDVCSICDYHERTGLLPKGMTKKRFEELMKECNLVPDMESEIDPAGGHGLYSHI